MCIKMCIYIYIYVCVCVCFHTHIDCNPHFLFCNLESNMYSHLKRRRV